MQYYKVLNDDVTNPLLDQEEKLASTVSQLRESGVTEKGGTMLLEEAGLTGKCHSIDITSSSPLFSAIEVVCEIHKFEVKWNKSRFVLIEKDAWIPKHYNAQGEAGYIIFPFKSYDDHYHISTDLEDGDNDFSFITKMQDSWFGLTKNYETNLRIKYQTSVMPTDYLFARISLASVTDFLIT